MKTQHTYTLEEATANIAKLTKVKPSEVKIENDYPISLILLIIVSSAIITANLIWRLI